MTQLAIVGLWLFVGAAGFFFARAALESFACQPITYATLLLMFLCMWTGPITVVAGLTWTICYIADGGGFDWLHKEVANPCKWFRRLP